jgi:hypothetical protein
MATLFTVLQNCAIKNVTRNVSAKKASSEVKKAVFLKEHAEKEIFGCWNVTRTQMNNADHIAKKDVMNHLKETHT